MESDMLLDMEVNKKNDIDIDINMEIQFGERVGHGAWLMVNWAQTFSPKA